MENPDLERLLSLHRAIWSGFYIGESGTDEKEFESLKSKIETILMENKVNRD